MEVGLKTQTKQCDSPRAEAVIRASTNHSLLLLTRRENRLVRVLLIEAGRPLAAGGGDEGTAGVGVQAKKTSIWPASWMGICLFWMDELKTRCVEVLLQEEY